MYNDSDSGVGGFLGLVTLGAAFFIGRRTGENKAIQVMNDRQRDHEIAELKRQIAFLQRERQ